MKVGLFSQVPVIVIVVVVIVKRYESFAFGPLKKCESHIDTMNQH